MKLLYSDILPLPINEHQQSVLENLREQLASAQTVEIAVGYISRAALEELDSLLTDSGIQKITLLIGMYYIEGMPESSFHTARKINKKWTANGIGEIRLIKPFKYHGKVYLFTKPDGSKSVIIGSANLGVLKPDASSRRQYELACCSDDADTCEEIAEHIKNLAGPTCSANIDDITDMELIREQNVSLSGVDRVTQFPPSTVDLYDRHKTDISFKLPLKVPAFNERHIDDKRHYTKSNINVCYAAPRSARKPRDWYETQLTVSADIYRMPGYPEKNVPFFVITDDGYWFLAHTTSSNNKQFSAVGDELIMGRWLKGRLAAAGLVTPVIDTKEDKDRLGMITQEILDAYGRNSLVFTKTDLQTYDDDGVKRDIWTLSFEAE